jgi:lipopolysaccharide export system ATP-binding protein
MLKLQAVELNKSYRGRKVVDDVELEIGQGEVVGLLGPKGWPGRIPVAFC